MSKIDDLLAFAILANGSPSKFPAVPHADSASCLSAYAKETACAAGSVNQPCSTAQPRSCLRRTRAAFACSPAATGVRRRSLVHLQYDHLKGIRATEVAAEMKILVTGGAGFIGSHTCDRLIALGHDVIVLDALTQPVHRDGGPVHLSPRADFYQGDVRNRDLVTNLLRRVDAVYHFAAYQDYLTDFSRFSDVNVVSTALLYEIIVAERLDLARVVVASSQSAMGEGLYRCPSDGEQLPGMRREKDLAAGKWDVPCPECGGPLEMQATPERISNPQNAYGMSKLGEEMVAVNLGRRYGIPTVALRYSIVQGPRQSVYNAYSGACRIFCLSYLQGVAPTLYEDGGAIRDYVNIYDVVDANILALEDERAVGRVFNAGGGKAVTTREFADVVMRQYGSAEPGVVTGEYRFGDTRHILSDISALRALGWEPRRTTADSVASYADWLKGMDGLDGVLAEANARMRALGVVRRSEA
jgi:dTDP-L-rhamnose 4-epimerase